MRLSGLVGVLNRCVTANYPSLRQQRVAFGLHLLDLPTQTGPIPDRSDR
jgi:hypothetical protein